MSNKPSIDSNNPDKKGVGSSSSLPFGSSSGGTGSGTGSGSGSGSGSGRIGGVPKKSPKRNSGANKLNLGPVKKRPPEPRQSIEELLPPFIIPQVPVFNSLSEIEINLSRGEEILNDLRGKQGEAKYENKTLDSLRFKRQADILEKVLSKISDQKKRFLPSESAEVSSALESVKAPSKQAEILWELPEFVILPPAAEITLETDTIPEPVGVFSSVIQESVDSVLESFQPGIGTGIGIGIGRVAPFSSFIGITSEDRAPFLINQHDSWFDLTSEASKNAVYCFSFRWNEHKENNQLVFDSAEEFIIVLQSLDFKKYVFQKEIDPKTHQKYWQGYVKIKTKLRPKQIQTTLNRKGCYNIELRSGRDEVALIRYCSKTEFRISGERVYSFPPNL